VIHFEALGTFVLLTAVLTAVFATALIVEALVRVFFALDEALAKLLPQPL
jgi:hypothetical protein